MIKLVVDNTKLHSKKIPTCMDTCSLYDPIMQQCGVFKEADIQSTATYARCQVKIPHNSIRPNPRFDKELEEHIIKSSYPEWYESAGEVDKELFEESYPFRPSNTQGQRDDTVWYFDPERKFGCWILNQSDRKLTAIDKSGPEKGWGDTVYRSPVPLHDHQAPLPLCSKMCWYVDEDGYGQYVLMDNGIVKMISQPKSNTIK
jgi:hypothetical protein